MWGLAIGAAMGGGIAALQGKKMEDVLKGAAIGGAMGAAGGALAPAAGIGGATVEGLGSTAGSTAIVEGTGTAATAFPVAGGSNVAGTALNNGIASLPSTASWAAPQLAGVPSSTLTDTGSFIAADQAASQAATNQAANATGKGFFDSGIGKTLADNKGMLGMGALGLMALKPQGSGGAPEQTGYIRPQTYNPSNQTYTAQTPVKATDWGTRSVAEGGVIRMAEGGDPEIATTEQQRENRTNPTLEALAALQQAQQTYQPPQQSQGITQPFIQPQMAQIQQQYSAPQRTAPEAFQYQAPSFVKYANVGGGGIAGAGGGGGEAIDPITKQPVKTVAQIIAAKAAAAKPTGSGVSGTYTGPGMNGDAESYYDRYPIAEVYDYTNNQPTRPNNPTEGSPEFNVPSNQPVDPSSGLAEIQQRYANMGYTDYTPSATNTDSGAANGGLMPDALRYAMGGGIGSYYGSPDDGNRNFDGISGLNQGPQYPMQGVAHADGGVMNYAMGGQLGGYSDGGQLLRGPGDGISDQIPAVIGSKQPARLADNEFVLPARIVSEIGNGSTDAGAKRLYAMMDRIQKRRSKTTGKGNIAVDSGAHKELNRL
jgi:hypothetical protein